MRKTFHALPYIIILFFSCQAFSQIASPYQVGLWQGFRSAPISFTCDDNCPGQISTLVPMFNTFGFKLTLFTITGGSFSQNWSGLQSAALQGHEVASHTVDHLDLGTMSGASQTNELGTSLATINGNVPAQKCVSIAYPGCVPGTPSIVQQYYLAARGCGDTIANKNLPNILNIPSFICGPNGTVQTAADFQAKEDSVVSSGWWVVFTLHAIDGDPGFSPVPSAMILTNLTYLNANPDKFWVTSFGNVVKYVNERNTVSISATSNHVDTITVHITDSLDNTIYNCPLTIQVPIPAGWGTFSVQQHGTNIASKTINGNTIQFDAIPNSGDVTLYKGGSPPPPPPLGSGPRIIPKTGGTYLQTNLVSGGSNIIRVVFPSGFSSKSVTFSAVLSKTGNSSNTSVNTNSLARYDFTSTLEYSVIPVQFTLKYPEGMIPPGHTDSQLGLYSFDGKEWVKIDGILDTVNNVFVFNSNKLSGEYCFFVTDPNYLDTGKKPLSPDVTHWSFNPFSPNDDGICDVTRMEINIPSASKVTFQIFDRDHRLVRDLLNAPKVSGKTFVEWDGKDDKGKVVSPGAYIYIIKIGDIIRKGVIVVAY